MYRRFALPELPRGKVVRLPEPELAKYLGPGCGVGAGKRAHGMYAVPGSYEVLQGGNFLPRGWNRIGARIGSQERGCEHCTPTQASFHDSSME